MRYVQRIQSLYLVILFFLDLVISSLTKAFLPTSILFISNLHFMGILLLAKNDTKATSLFRGIAFGIIMDLIHVNSFPTYFIAYSVTIVLIRMWERHIGFNLLEFILMVIVGLFIKEFLTYSMIVLINNVRMSFPYFIATRVIWVIFGNVLMISLVRKGYEKVHIRILKKAENLYIDM